jgi:hypothetical protein
MSILESSVYAGFWRRKQDFRDKFIKHLVTRPWSPVQVMQWSILDSKKPRDQTREDDKLWGPIQKSAESCGTRSYVQLGEKLTTRAHMQRGEPTPHERGRQLGLVGPRPVGPGRSAQAGRPSPVQGPFASPFDLAANQTIYSPGVKSHASINSSSAAEEQRSEGHHPREERVELVD